MTPPPAALRITIGMLYGVTALTVPGAVIAAVALWLGACALLQLAPPRRKNDTTCSVSGAKR